MSDVDKNLTEEIGRQRAWPVRLGKKGTPSAGWAKHKILSREQAWPLAVVLLVGAFFLLWRIDQLPPNIVDEPLGGAIAAWAVTFKKEVIAATINAIDESRRTQLLDLTFLNQNSLDWFTAWGYFDLYPMAYPLGVVVAATSFWLFGASLAVFATVSSAAGLLSVLLLYLLGRRMYGTWVGMLAAALLATSFYFLNYIRGPMVTMSISLAVPLAILFIYFLYLGTETKRPVYWWLTGIVGGLSIFNGWMIALLLPGIALLFLVANANWLVAWQGVQGKAVMMGQHTLGLLRLSAKGLWRYVAVLALAIAFGILLSVLWSLFLGMDPLASLRGIYSISIQHRAGSIAAVSAPTKLGNMLYFWNGVFVSNTIVEPALKLLLGLGIVVCLWKRSSADRLLLSWLLGGFAAFTLIIVLAAPYFLITVFPAICLVAARPLAATLRWAAGPDSRVKLGMRAAPLSLFALPVIVWLIWNGAQTYDRYFVKQQALGFSADYSQIARFLETASPTEPAVVVYPDYIADLPFEVSFHFANKPRPFRFFPWTSPEARRKPPWVSFNTFEPEGIAQWERLILTRYPKLFFIVPRDEPWYQQSFSKLHPGLAPLKTVEPVIRLDIYQVAAPSASGAAKWADGQLLVEDPSNKSVMSFRKDNLLKNGSFQEWAGSIPKDWQLFSVSGLSASLSRSSEGKGSSAAVTIKPSALSQSLYQDFTAEKGVSYFTSKNLTFGVWAKSKEPTGKLHLQFRVNNSGTMGFRIFDITSDYGFYSITLENAPAGEKGYRVEIMPGDDYQFNEITIADAVLLEGPYCWDGYCSEQDINSALKKSAESEPTSAPVVSSPQAPTVSPGEGYQEGKPSLPSSLSAGRASNQLQNPSFELWDNDVTAISWSPFYSTPEPITFAKSQDSKSGQYAVLLKPTAPSQAIYQDFTGQLGIDYFTGKKVTFGVWAKSVAPTGVMRLHIRRDNNYTEKIEYFKLTDKYQFFSITSDKLAPATSEGYRVEIIPGDGQIYNDVLVDDVSLEVASQ